VTFHGPVIDGGTGRAAVPLCSSAVKSAMLGCFKAAMAESLNVNRWPQASVPQSECGLLSRIE